MCAFTCLLSIYFCVWLCTFRRIHICIHDHDNNICDCTSMIQSAIILSHIQWIHCRYHSLIGVYFTRTWDDLSVALVQDFFTMRTSKEHWIPILVLFPFLLCIFPHGWAHHAPDTFGTAPISSLHIFFIVKCFMSNMSFWASQLVHFHSVIKDQEYKCTRACTALIPNVSWQPSELKVSWVLHVLSSMF